jgi:hypothetical protein
MIRISLSSLALAASLVAGAVTPAASETLRNTDQPTSCDCSNCSAEHCQGGSTFSAIAFVGGWGSSSEAPKGFATQPVAVDPSNPNVVFVGGSRR